MPASVLELMQYMACEVQCCKDPAGHPRSCPPRCQLEEQGLPSSATGVLGKLWHTVDLTQRPSEVDGLSRGNNDHGWHLVVTSSFLHLDIFLAAPGCLQQLLQSGL